MIRQTKRATGAVLSCLLSMAAVTQAQTLNAPNGPSFGEVNPVQMARMINSASDEPFYMVNLIQFREKAQYPDGRATDLTGREANQRYNPIQILREIGADIVFVAEVEDTRHGDGTMWDQVAIVRYPSRRAFLQMSQRPDFQARSIHKTAGVGKSIVMVSRPVDLETPASPSSGSQSTQAAGNGAPLDWIQVIRYRDPAGDGNGLSETHLASPNATVEAPAAAVRFEVEGVLIGDGRRWHEVRFQSLSGRPGPDPDAQRIEESYSLRVRPALDRLERR